jgi:hypothetical protein
MMIRPGFLCAGLILLAGSTVLQAHQVAGGTHQHVWRPTAYGKDYRPGHSVNGPTGSITIWSPAALNEYGSNNAVQFANPAPYIKQSAKQSSNQVQSRSNIPRSNVRPQSNIPRIKSLAPSRYGKDYKRDYGK